MFSYNDDSFKKRFVTFSPFLREEIAFKNRRHSEPKEPDEVKEDLKNEENRCSYPGRHDASGSG